MNIHETIYGVEDDLVLARSTHRDAMHRFKACFHVPGGIRETRDLTHEFSAAVRNLRQASLMVDDLGSSKRLLIRLREAARAELTLKKAQKICAKNRNRQNLQKLAGMSVDVSRARRKLRTAHKGIVTPQELQEMLAGAMESIMNHGERLCYQ